MIRIQLNVAASGQTRPPSPTVWPFLANGNPLASLSPWTLTARGVPVTLLDCHTLHRHVPASPFAGKTPVTSRVVLLPPLATASYPLGPFLFSGASPSHLQATRWLLCPAWSKRWHHGPPWWSQPLWPPFSPSNMWTNRHARVFVLSLLPAQNRLLPDRQ